MPDRIPVIVNPAARSRRAVKIVTQLEALRPAPELHFTEYPGHATVIAERLAGEGRPLVVAAGGDGTVNEVLQGVCKVNATRPNLLDHTALGTLPAGTMNVFALELGFRSHRQLLKPWSIIASGARKTVDLWLANDQYFVQLAGIGLDAEIIRKTTSESKNRYGPLSYVMSAARVLGKRPPVLTLTAAGRLPLLGSIILVGNGSNYGGRFRMFRHARHTDGKLDVVIFRDALNFLSAMQLLCGTWLGKFHRYEDIDYLHFCEFTVTSDKSTAVEVDGELSGTTPVTFRRAPFPLRVAAA